MKTLIYIIAILLLFAACSKPEPIESNPTITYHRLKTEQLNKTPYFTNPDFDTLTYLSNKGDTLIFAKLKTDTTWYYIRTQGAPGVTLNEDYYQTLRNTYQTIKGNGKFEVRHELKNIVTGVFYLQFMNSNYQIVDENIGATFSQSYIQFLTINGKEYRDVNALSQGNKITCYLNSIYGVFYAIDSTNNINWLLNN
ncbi:MAG: hypothetical protein ACK4K9_08420 [Bacteroidia bacterium]